MSGVGVSICNFFRGIKDKADKNYHRNATVLEGPMKAFGNVAGTLAWSLSLKGAGTIADHYWQPTEYRELCATVGTVVGVIGGAGGSAFSNIGARITRGILAPVNKFVSYMNATGEQITDSVASAIPEFNVLFNYIYDSLLWRYKDEKGQQKGYHPNPAQYGSVLIGGPIAMYVAGDSFVKAADFMGPHNLSHLTAAPIACATMLTLAKPIFGVATFILSGLITPFACCYTRCSCPCSCCNESKEQPAQPGLKEMLLDRRYTSVSVSNKPR